MSIEWFVAFGSFNIYNQ